MATITMAICARNAQDIIVRCLASIQRQTVQPDKVVVAVDELSDPTAAVAREYGAEVIASNATGLYEARNAVLAACDTDYLGFTDADCELAPVWVERAIAVLDAHADVAAGTGRHPPLGTRNFAGWLHHMWFVVETRKTGETDGVIGGNSFFRVKALRETGGWLRLPRHSAAEDLYISLALRKAGWRIWFEEEAVAYHNYEKRLKGLWRKSVMMGRDIIVMHRAAGWYEGFWWYSLAIPALAAAFLSGLAWAVAQPWPGVLLAAAPLALSYVYLAYTFRSLRAALPRWAARWILIWPYSWGILKGLLTPAPDLREQTMRLGYHA